MVRIHRGSPSFAYPRLQAWQATDASFTGDSVVSESCVHSHSFRIGKFENFPDFSQVKKCCPCRLAWSRTLPFHGRNRGSNPLRDASHFLQKCLASQYSTKYHDKNRYSPWVKIAFYPLLLYNISIRKKYNQFRG